MIAFFFNLLLQCVISVCCNHRATWLCQHVWLSTAVMPPDSLSSSAFPVFSGLIYVLVCFPHLFPSWLKTLARRSTLTDEMKPCQGLNTAPKIHPHNWQGLACLMPVHADTSTECSTESKQLLFHLTWDLFLSTWVQPEYKYHTPKSARPETTTVDIQTWRRYNWGFILRRPEHLSCWGFQRLLQTVSIVWYSDYIASFSRHTPYVLLKVKMKEDSNKQRP